MCRVCTVEALERELSLILCFPPGASVVIGFFSLFFFLFFQFVVFVWLDEWWSFIGPGGCLGFGRVRGW